MDDNYKTPLIVEAVRMAARNVTFADNAIFHSDYAELCVKPRNRVLACAGGVVRLIPRLNEEVLSEAVEGLELVLGESLRGR